MAEKRRILGDKDQSASYCCEAAGVVSTKDLPKEDAFQLKRKLSESNQSASYCCEAAETLSAEKLPPENAY
jgi:hypothetical protein